jgi:hypothetical protein
MMRPPLDIRVDIAPDAEPDGDPQDWLWRDVSGYRRQADDVEINYGRDDEAGQAEAGDASLTFDLRDGLLSPRNPNSELYGRIGPNTPVRLRLPLVEDTFTRTVSAGWGTSDSDNAWSSASSIFSVNGAGGVTTLAAANSLAANYLDTAALDIDATYSVSLPAVTTGAPWISGFMLRRQDASNYYEVRTELKPAGVVTTKLVRVLAGVSTDLIEDLTTSATYSAGTKVWTRIVADGGLFRAKVWSGVIGDEPDAWNIWSTLVRIEAGGLGVYQWRFVGNTNVGSLASTVDDLTIEALIWSGNVPEWPPRWDKSGEDSTMTIAAAGPIRRLNQGDDPIKSPLTRQLPRYSPAAYWPLEDGSDAVSAGSALTGGRATKTVAVTFGSDDCPPGASSAAQMTAANSIIQGQILGDTTGSFSALFFIKFESLPAGDTVVADWRAKTGTMRRWVIRANAGGWQLKVYDNTDTLLHDGGTLLYVDGPTQWTAVQLETQQNGGNVDWTLIWNRLDRNDFWAVGGSVAGTAARLAEVYFPGSTGMTNALLSHIWAGTNALPFVDVTFFEVSRGYAGELAADRISRLCAEQNVAVSITPGDSEPLGRQRSARFLDLLREAAAADLGLLYERAGSLAYVPRSARYRTAVRLELDWTGGDLAQAPKPTDDDQRLRNRWVVKRLGGSEATYEDPESIRKRGAVGDSAEVNIELDERLPDYASWFTFLTTIDQLRWPTIELDLVAHPELIPQFLTCRIGSRLTVANPQDQVAGTTIDLLIEHISQTIGQYCWLVTLTCSPASLWDVGVYDDADGRRDSASTTLGADRTDSQTSWTFTTQNAGDLWDTTITDCVVTCGGEDVTVTSMGAPSGTGPYTQTATVTRSVNQIVKDQTAGTPIHVKYPVIRGL